MGSTGRHILTNGAVVGDAATSLRFGRRGPLLVEDCVVQEVLLAFAHSVQRPRVVHSRGVVVRGWFECTEPLDDVCAVHAFGSSGRRTPAVVRFSMMSGRPGVADSSRDVRGMAVRLSTVEGDLDLLCQSIPVSFVQDALLYPQVVATRRALTARGFWRLVGEHPETIHAVLHLMSSRGLPAGYETMDAHAVHTFRLVGASGRWRYAKFHWIVAAGSRSIDAHEALAIGMDDPAHHTRRLLAAVRHPEPPTWHLAVQVFDEDTAATLPYDVLDPTKLIPEQEVPVRLVGRLVLDDGEVPSGPVDATGSSPMVEGDDADLGFSAAHLVPGIDVSEDPVLQARIAAYLPAHLARMGPAALQPRRTHATEAALVTPQIIGVSDHVERVRHRPPLFADHHGQAREFWQALPAHEQAHVIDAISRDLRNGEPSVTDAVLVQLDAVDPGLGRSIARCLDGVSRDDMRVEVGRRP